MYQDQDVLTAHQARLTAASNPWAEFYGLTTSDTESKLLSSSSSSLLSSSSHTTEPQISDDELIQKFLQHHSSSDFRRYLFYALPWIILALIFLSIMSVNVTYSSIATLASQLIADVHLSNVQYGLLFTAFGIPNMFMPFIGGFLIDKIGISTAFLAFGLFITVGAYTIALGVYTESYLLMLLGRMITGAGADCTFVIADSFALLWFSGGSRSLGLAFTINANAQRVAEIMIFNTLPAIAYYTDERFALLCAAVFCSWSLVWNMVLGLTDRVCSSGKAVSGDVKDMIDPIRSKNATASSGHSKIEFTDVLRFPRAYWILVGMMMCYYSVVWPFLDYTSEFLQSHWEYSAEAAGRFVSLASLTAVITGPLVGYLLDRFGYRLMCLTFGTVLMIPALVLLMFPPFNPVISMLIMGFGITMTSATIWPELALIVKPQQFGTAYGFSVALANFVYSPVYYLIGWLLDEFDDDHRVAILVLLILTVIAVFLSVLWNYVDRIDYDGKGNKSQRALQAELLFQEDH